MKSIVYTLTIVLTIIGINIAQAQNLMLNGDLESWTGGEPDGWTVYENISQESGTIHGGTYSAKHTSESTTKDFQQVIGGIQEGEDYTISYWYYDNDQAARTRIWSYWTSGGSNLPDNGAELRPGTYSEDNPTWQEFNLVLTAPATADGFKFEVRVYNQDGNTGGSVFYDDFEFTGDVVIDPEPSNYPTDFIATASGLSIDLDWTDATGTQLPDAYLIVAGDSPSLPVPTDGTPVANDPDLSDGSGALNVNYGVETATFSNLEGNTTYYFAIYSYTNSGANIDYKNDGTAPTANATTANLVLINSEDFEDGTLGTWWQYSVASDNIWHNAEYGGNKYAYANSYGDTEAGDDWLISPSLNLNDYDNEVLVFETAKNFDDVIEGLDVNISTDYTGSGDPYQANWTTLTATLSTGNFTWTASGDVDISGFNADNVYIAFHYQSTGTTSGTSSAWEVDNIAITGEEDIVIYPEPSNYPTEFEALANNNSISLYWTDATGTQLPEKYIIFAGTDASLPMPVDGTPVPDDTDLSDGSGALNISFGVEEATFLSLVQGETYYFSIYSYTNNGSNIDYKNDGTAPTANATIPLIPEPTSYPTEFTATATGTAIDLTWTDATGTQLPEAYIIVAGITSSLPAPVDGTPIADDLDLSDGEGAVNVLYGVEEASFEGLEPGTQYFFAIYPYTNSGVAIDYKNDGTAPTANATIPITPEPTNYPADFTATANNTTINLTWTDATGAQLPEAYIIFAGTDASLPVPVDGTPVEDDTDLSDGSGALNISFGIEETSFGGLEPGTIYYFSIYPYTNSGAIIDFKTDGSAPTAEATTGVSPTIEYQNFDNGFDDWTIYSVTGAEEWEVSTGFGFPDPPCARMSGYNGTSSVENEDWLISPSLNLNNYVGEVLTFYTAQNFDVPALELKVSEDYSGSGDPNAATWTTVPFNLAASGYEWTESGEIDLSGFTGSSVYVAFVYYSTNSESAVWEVDEILIEQSIINPEPSNYPSDFNAEASGSSINLTWTDATGSQLPEAYIILAGISSSLPVPEDGTPIPDDTDLSDGSGALNIDYGLEQAMFSSLDPSTTYYFSIYPYSNDGANIDYKNDGTAPTANATTSNVQVVTIESENFNEDWGNWTIISVTGSQEWSRDNTYGPDFTPCAQMSGYSGGSYFNNEDWLISPTLNLDDYENEIITFMNAQNYSGPDMELKVSNDYSGSGDPNNATWTDLSYTMSGGSFTWQSSGNISLNDITGTSVYIAFVYTSTTSSAATWEVDNIFITGEQEAVILPEPTNYPTAFSAMASGTSIDLSWTDAIGEQLPDAYIVFAGTDPSLPVPVDGTPIPDDTNLGDGSGSLNVEFGIGAASFSNLISGTTYYFSIYSYTNSGVNTDFKNDGTSPTSSATTGYSPVILYQNFSDGWNGWETVSVTGAPQWQIDDGYGMPDPPCGRISGYSGGSYVENEDWMISPAMNLSETQNEVLTFYNAMNFDGPPLELKISTDYDGGGNPNSATWEDLSFEQSTGFYQWVESGEIDLSGFNSNAVYIAFVYYSTTSQGSLYEIDEIKVEDNSEQPEPSNYPTSFSADASGSSILVTWADATGIQLPEGYVVYGGTDDNLPVPNDGVPVTNDPDLSDGFASAIVDFGEQEILFEQLDPSTTYYFTIFPFTNDGSSINYKNDGSAPTSNATTENVILVMLESENFDDGWGNWTRVSVTGTQEWTRDNNYGPDDSPCAQMSGYENNIDYENEDWLISPALNLDNYNNELLLFDNAQNYSGPDLQLKISNNYSGSGDPNAATWTGLSFIMSSGGFTWQSSGNVSLSDFTGNSVYIAFVYTSTTSNSATWELDNIVIRGEQEYVVKPEPTNYPADFSAEGLGKTIKVTWTDATGSQLPDGYLVYAGTSEDLPVPQDGVPVQLDSDLSDGIAVVKVPFGDESYSFVNGTEAFTTYYCTVYPFTNIGNDVDYKNDGTAPVSSAQTTNTQEVTILEQGFDDWNGWTTYNVSGEQIWDIDNTYGIDYSPCAQMSGYSGGAVVNEDWLISPAMDFDLYLNEKLSFYNAMNYSGPNLKLKISNDYDGTSDPNNATWTDLSYTMSTGGFTYVYSGKVDLSELDGNEVYIAFLYTSTNSGAATWELDNIKVTGDTEIGIDESSFNNNVSVYPNPAGDFINIRQTGYIFSNIEIRNITGKVVRSLNLSEDQETVDLSDFDPGMYFITFFNENSGKTYSTKIIVK